jgi:tripartite-type tricarboxylate transporter receptor subunit TctC
MSLSLAAPLQNIFKFSRILCFALVALSLSSLAVAQTKPTDPLRIVVAWPPGGPTDTIARIVGQHLGTVLARPVVVENRSGAAGLIGTESVIRAAPDGSTLLMAVFQDVTRPALGARQKFDVMSELAHWPRSTTYHFSSWLIPK